MPEKLIRLPQLQRFKAKADLKYQNKLVAGDNINITGNTISAIATPSNPTFTKLALSNREIDADTITVIDSVTIMPGTYFLVYTCYFGYSRYSEYFQCGFSTNTTDITGYGRAWGDFKFASGTFTQPCVAGVFNVSASSYPNGQTFYLLAKQNRARMQVYPSCSYVKLA